MQRNVAKLLMDIKKHITRNDPLLFKGIRLDIKVGKELVKCSYYITTLHITPVSINYDA